MNTRSARYTSMTCAEAAMSQNRYLLVSVVIGLNPRLGAIALSTLRILATTIT
jgi:hypothetical protein